MTSCSRLLAWLCVLGCLGCAPSVGEAFSDSFYAAKRAYNAGRYEQAAALYEEAAAKATRVKDRDEANFMQARMYERMENWKRAQKAYQKLIATSAHGPRTARAAYEYADVEIEHGDAERGWSLLRDTISRYPNHGSSKRALQRWLAHTAEVNGENVAREQLMRWSESLRGSDAAQQISYEHARSLERSGRLEEAHRGLVALARAYPYPDGSLTDDAWWHASFIAEQLGKHQLAIDDLRALLQPREVGVRTSYERPRYPQAQMRIAELYRDRFGDPEMARREFRKTYQAHTTSILADDAMWQEALLARKAGDESDVCDLADDLRDREPESRYRRCARALCPKLKPEKRDPDAKPLRERQRTCPPYLLRQLEDGASDTIPVAR